MRPGGSHSLLAPRLSVSVFAVDGRPLMVGSCWQTCNFVPPSIRRILPPHPAASESGWFSTAPETGSIIAQWHLGRMLHRILACLWRTMCCIYASNSSRNCRFWIVSNQGCVSVMILVIHTVVTAHTYATAVRYTSIAEHAPLIGRLVPIWESTRNSRIW